MVISVKGVSKRYGEAVALEEVSLEAPNGAVTGFVGPNGAGKSTLLRAVAGLVVPDAGMIKIDGQAFVQSPNPGRTLGVFLSAERVPATMTAASFLRYAADLQGLSSGAVDETLDTVGLRHASNKKVKTFSLGMRQRLGIGAAIMSKPSNLVLDEPINGLDPDAIVWLREYLRSVALAGGAVLLSSHHMSELGLIADHVIMVDRGRVVRSGPVASFVASSQMRTYFETDDLAGALQVLAAQGLRCEGRGAGAVVFDTPPRQVASLLVQAGPGVSHLRQLERTIEETYFEEISARGDEQVTP